MFDGNKAIQCLELAMKAGADKAQCSFSKSYKFEMNVESGEISLLRTTYDSGIGVTVIKDNRRGSISSNSIDGDSIKKGVEEALELAKASQPDPAYDIAEKQAPEEFTAGNSEPDKELMYDRLMEFLNSVKGLYPKVVLRNVILDFTRNSTRLVNSNGVDFTIFKGMYDFGVVFSAREGDKTSSFNYSGFSTRELDKPLLTMGLIDTLLRQSQEQVETSSVKGKFEGDVIMTPDCLHSFIYYFVDTFLRDGALISGTSIFKDSLGKEVASPIFSLHSRPVSREIADGYFVTHDGFKACNSTIVDRGVLKSFMLSLYGSRKTGRERAVNSGGAYVVDPGNRSLEEMIGTVKRGILMCRFSGGDPNSKGDFSGIAKNSYYIEDGKIRYPISETMVSGNLADAFKNIKDISSERVNFGNALLPWMTFPGITISGK